jgi:hypothetical protein
MANIYLVFNSVCNDVYKYDFMLVNSINCTDSATNTIYCYTLTGKQIWVFKDENVLREPRGIAFDKNKTFMWLV